MKFFYHFLAICLLLPMTSFAAAKAPAVTSKTIGLTLSEVKIVDLSKAVFSDLLKVPYVLETEFLACPDVVSIDAQTLKVDDVEAHLQNILEARGFAIRKRAGVTYIGKQTPADADSFVYRPKDRTVTYLVDLLAGVFPPGSFSSQRHIANPQAATTLQPLQSGQMRPGQNIPGQPQQQQSFDSTGNSAFAQINQGNQDTIIFKGNDKAIDRFQKLVGQLDTPSAEIMVKAIVYEVNHDATESSAVDLAIAVIKSRLGLNLTTGADAANAFKFSVGGISGVFSALSTDKRFKVMTSPSLSVKSGATARLTVGSDTPVLGSVSYSNNGQPVQSVNYQSSGVLLDIKPQVMEEGVDLQVSQQISSFIPTTNGVNSSPTLTKRELSTNIRVLSGEIVVLGGLDQTSNTDQSSRLSFLPDWLNSTGSNTSRNEIMLVLQVQRI